MKLSDPVARPLLPRAQLPSEHVDDTARPKVDAWNVVKRGACLMAPLAVGCMAGLATAGIPGLDVQRFWRCGGCMLEPMTTALVSKVVVVGVLGVWLGASALQTRRRATLLTAPQMRREIREANATIDTHRALAGAMVATQVLGFILKLDGKYLNNIMGSIRFNDLDLAAQELILRSRSPGVSIEQLNAALSGFQRDNPMLNFQSLLDNLAESLTMAPALIGAAAVGLNLWNAGRPIIQRLTTRRNPQATSLQKLPPARNAPAIVATPTVQPDTDKKQLDVAALASDIGEALAHLRGLDAYAKTPPRQEVYLLQLLRQIKDLPDEDLARLQSTPPPQDSHLLERGLAYVRHRVLYKNQGGLAKSGAQTHLGALLEAWVRCAKKTPAA